MKNYVQGSAKKANNTFVIDEAEGRRRELRKKNERQKGKLLSSGNFISYTLMFLKGICVSRRVTCNAAGLTVANNAIVS